MDEGVILRYLHIYKCVCVCVAVKKLNWPNCAYAFSSYTFKQWKFFIDPLFYKCAPCQMCVKKKESQTLIQSCPAIDFAQTHRNE